MEKLGQYRVKAKMSSPKNDPKFCSAQLKNLKNLPQLLKVF